MVRAAKKGKSGGGSKPYAKAPGPTPSKAEEREKEYEEYRRLDKPLGRDDHFRLADKNVQKYATPQPVSQTLLPI